MATRMQQRRGTAAQWTAANPTLAAGEIGFETDNNRFKIGDGVTAWGSLDYFANSAALSDLIDGAPDLLNTLGELATAIGEDPAFFTTVATNLSTHEADTTGVHGIPDTSLLVTGPAMSEAIGDHNDATTSVHGIADTSVLETISGAQAKADAAESEAIAAADAAALLAKTEAIADAATAAGVLVSDHSAETTDVHGIPDTSVLETTSGALDKANSAVSSHNDDTTNVHGIADTAVLETQSGAQDKADAAEAAAILAAASAADTKVSDHNSDTTNVHGIADTSVLATATTVATAKSEAIDAAAVASENYTDGVVAALTKSSVGLGNIDNTSDASKPVSTATQTALDLKANLAGATFSGDVTVETNLIVDGNLTVTGTTTTVDTQDLVVTDPMIYMGEGNSANLVDLGIVSSFNDGTYQHSGIVRDASAGKWKFFKGVTDEPTTTINFAQGSLDAVAVGALEATTVTPSAGIVFSDGTQVKVGVPSITAFATAISSSATIASGEQDKFVPLTGAVTITLPASGYSTGQSIDFYQASGTGAQFASTNSVVGTPGLKLRTTNSVATAMKTSSGWLVFGDLSA